MRELVIRLKQKDQEIKLTDLKIKELKSVISYQTNPKLMKKSQSKKQFSSFSKLFKDAEDCINYKPLDTLTVNEV